MLWDYISKLDREMMHQRCAH